MVHSHNVKMVQLGILGHQYWLTWPSDLVLHSQPFLLRTVHQRAINGILKRVWYTHHWNPVQCMLMISWGVRSNRWWRPLKNWLNTTGDKRDEVLNTYWFDRVLKPPLQNSNTNNIFLPQQCELHNLWYLQVLQWSIDTYYFWPPANHHLP